MSPMPGREEIQSTPGVKLTYDDFLLFPDDGQRHELIDGEHYVTPVIEVGSPGTRRRDETIKRRLYERSDVSEYWIVDPELEVVRVYQREGQGFGRPRERSREAGDVLESALFPSFTLPLDTVFRS